jgi:neutral amino acid transport system ATP-binding protein
MPADPTPTSGAHASGAHAGEKQAPRRLAQAALRDLPWEVGVAKPDPAIVVDGVTRTFGGLTAVSVDHLEIQRGGITGLIGPNGAGKTTLFNLLTGFDQPDTGTWSFDGQSLGKLSSHHVARMGVVRTFQLTKALSRLTVMQNMLLGARGSEGRASCGRSCPACGAARRRRTPSGRWTCCSGSSWTPRRTTSPARCPAVSASCSRWPGR